jgi:two-component system, cell cycle sensor histidine kinase and response regulator CckA
MMTTTKRKRSNGASKVDVINKKVLQVARRVSATIGTDFFQMIAKHLAKALVADCVVIGEFVSGPMEGVRTFGAYMDGQSTKFEYDLAGSASASILLGKPCQGRQQAQTRFPEDKLLAMVGAEAFIGEPLVDMGGQPIGLIMALYRRPVTSFDVARRILQVFSARAAGELNRKREEDALRESDQRYRAFVARNLDAMWRIEFERPIDTTHTPQNQLAEMYQYGYVAECNDAFALMVGRDTAEQVIGSRLCDVAPQSDRRLLAANLRSIEHGYDFTTIETSRLDRSGTRQYLLRSQWGIVEDGMLERVWGTTRNITEIKQCRQKFDASERRMVKLLETLKLVVIIENPEGKVAYCNPYFYRKTGWGRADIMGQQWLDRIVPSDQRVKLLGIVEKSKTKPDASVHFECSLLGAVGREWVFEWDRAALSDAEGRIISWANVGRDVTERKALEGSFRQAQKLATIGTLAGGIAHDFNNLLTVILGYSHRLLEQKGRSEAEYTGLEEIQKAAYRGAELTHRLLAFGRRQSLNPEVLGLHGMIADSEEMLRGLIGEHIRLTTNLDPLTGSVLMDASSFHQVLMNLVVNARDSMPRGGSLTVSTANETFEQPDEISGMEPGQYVVVTVSDTGTGMTAEAREHLFEPFFTTKDRGKGTGLGLATAYGIVQQSGGAILVDTEPNKGTTFRIYLPLVTEPAQLEQGSGATDALPRGSETILLVEDREDVRELAIRTLHELGYTVLEADGSDRAIQLAQDLSRPIHLLLTDVVMPGMKGFELAAFIQRYQSEVRVLFISGYKDRSRAGEKPPNPDYVYLHKPFTPQALAVAVRRVLDR